MSERDFRIDALDSDLLKRAARYGKLSAAVAQSVADALYDSTGNESGS